MDASSSTSTTVMVAADPLSSLRAVALSTLRPHRRKQVLELPTSRIVPTRPPPPSDNFQLDYGQDDDVTMTDIKGVISPKLPEQNRQPSNIPTAADEDMQMREEGEISEEEEPPPRVIVKQPMSLLDRLSDSPMPIVARMPTPDITSMKREPFLSGHPLTTDIQPQASKLSLAERISDIRSYSPEPATLVVPVGDEESFRPPLVPLVGPGYVRPGLELTQEEYDTVKDIVLDLLGWAVPFEHLMECGISKEVIYYVFNELNLRLPDTFDTSGMTPYSPEALAQWQSSHFPPVSAPSVLERGRRSSIASSVASDNPTKIESTLKVSSPASVPVHETPDLNDMERSRRQELMARKAAVQASQRQKKLASIDVSSSVMDQGTSGASVPSVDDFLKSIGPVPERRISQTSDTSATHNEVAETSSLEAFLTSAPANNAILEDSAPSQPLLSPNPISELDEHRTTSIETPPTSVDSTVSTFSVSSLFSEPSLAVSAFPPRRGTKRPVAADFVDFDPAPKRHELHPRAHFFPPSQSTGITRKLTSGNGFQSITSRRCVIELSDSDDDDDDAEGDRQPTEEPTAWQDRRSKPLSKLNSSVPVKPASQSSDALAEKEAEIRRMRELIARREEETRLRKLVLTRSASVAASLSQPVTPQTEEQTVDSSEEFTSVSSRSSESATPTSATIESSTGNDYTGSLSVSTNQEHAGERQDMTTVTQEAQAVSEPSPMESSPQHEQESKPLQQGSVDVDTNPSPSAQAASTSTLLVPQKQDESLPESQPPLNSNSNSDASFTAYRSPFESYPLLLHTHRFSSSQDVQPSHNLSTRTSDMYHSQRSLLSSVSSAFVAEQPTFQSSHYSSADIPIPNLNPLKQATVTKLLNPFIRLCQYEVPGGGTCRDEGCEDLHLSRLEGAIKSGIIEPNDEDAANYLFNFMPNSWLSRHGIDSVSSILSALQDVRRKTQNYPMNYEDRIRRALGHLVSPSPT